MLTKGLSQARWRLADHVRACLVDGQVFVLDLYRNKYLAVGSCQDRALAQAIDRWPATDGETQADISPADADKLVAPLLSRGLVTREPASGAVSTSLAEAVCSLEVQDLARGRTIGWRRPASLIRSAVVAALWLRSRSMAEMAAAVTARRGRMAGPQPHPGSSHLEDAMVAYIKCRPFLFSAHDRCLHDSLTLVHYLAGEGLSAAWVVGVRARPFGAHSWVQSGSVVLNDQHEHVRRYQPILVV